MPRRPGDFSKNDGSPTQPQPFPHPSLLLYPSPRLIPLCCSSAAAVDIYGQMEHAKHDLAQKPSAGTHMDEQQWGKRRTAEEMQQEARQWRDFMRVDLASRSSHVQH